MSEKLIKEATKKLPYDMPRSIAKTLTEDAKKMGLAATHLLIKLINDNHERIGG